MKIKPSIITVRQAQKEDKLSKWVKAACWIMTLLFLMAYKDAVDVVIK